MTTEEAIKELRDASDNEVRYGDTEHHYNEVMKRIEALDMAIKALEQQPKTGHWINLEKTKYKGQVLPFWDRYECSECGNHGQGDFNFCPNCGARMTESEDK